MAVTDGTTTDGVLPHQGIYQQRKAEAEAAYQRALANLSHKRSGILQDYGFQAEFDEEGNLSSYGVDPGNEYGILQMSRREQAADLDAAEEQSRLRGFGRKGFGAQDTEQLRYAQGAQNVQLGRGFLDSLYGVAGEQSDAVGAKNAAFLGIEQEQLYEALTNRLFNPAPDEEEPADGDPGSIATVKWAGADRTKENLVKHLRSKGVNPAYWAWKHQGAAQKLGMTVPKSRPIQLIKRQKLARTEKNMTTRRKKGWSRRKMVNSPNWKRYVKQAGAKRSAQLLRRLYPSTMGPRRTKRNNRRRRR